MSVTPSRADQGGRGEATGRTRGPVSGNASGQDRSRPPRPRALRRLGQNHLVDRNILRAIVEQADVSPGDVVLEVGAAGGLLTLPLLERARAVHAFEIDARWLPRLRELAAARPALHLHEGDAMKADLIELAPPPTAVVANLAYNIAIPLIMTTIQELPAVQRWSVMVQKELADRLFAAPRTKPYAAVSVLTQLACRREASRLVPPSAFRPRPRVESAFVTFVRRTASEAGAADPPLLAPEAYRAMDRLVRLAFGQRRKMLSTSLSGATRRGGSVSREDVHEALEACGLPATARPEELTPAQWVRFAARLDWPDAGGDGGEA